MQSQFQGSVNSSAMFLTGAAQNLLCLKLATELGVAIASPWLTWFKAAVVPALAGLLLTPLLIFKVRPPAVPPCSAGHNMGPPHVPAWQWGRQPPPTPLVQPGSCTSKVPF